MAQSCHALNVRNGSKADIRRKAAACSASEKHETSQRMAFPFRSVLRAASIQGADYAAAHTFSPRLSG